QDQLLAFIDGLNLAITSSPPLRVVNLAGDPSHWAMITGAVVQTVAQTSMHVLSKTLTDRYLRAANLRLFKPKGLVVRICTTAAMQHLVMRTGNGADLSTLEKMGRGVGTVLINPPKIQASTSGVGDGQKMPLTTQRRLASLEGFALPLNFDVPPPAKAQGVKDTMGSWGVKFDAWRTQRGQDKIEQKRRELVRLESQLQQLDINGATPPSAGPRHRKETSRQRKELGKVEWQVANADLIEHWQSNKVLWVVIINA
ncbi:hypothetical protein B0H19DRAFT_900507, partial [Mycena capillaripes]